MLALEERFMIREMYRKGVSISEIARRTGRDRKTIRQTVNAPDLLPPKQPRQVKACKIDPYAPFLEQRMADGVLNARIMRDKLRKVNPVKSDDQRKTSQACRARRCCLPCGPAKSTTGVTLMQVEKVDPSPQPMWGKDRSYRAKDVINSVEVCSTRSNRSRQ